MDLWHPERLAWQAGYRTVCGVDEAGAGPLLGPVCAAAVILPREARIPGLGDSKKLTPRRREAVYEAVVRTAAAWAVAWAGAEEIDALDILNARILAMQRAVEGLKVSPDLALVDGDRDRGSRCALTVPHRLLVRGDSLSASIAAASVLAKVSRDRYVTQVLDVRYPQYHIARHKGYGTRLHYEMLERFGPCPEHRKSFLKKWEAARHEQGPSQR